MHLCTVMNTVIFSYDVITQLIVCLFIPIEWQGLSIPITIEQTQGQRQLYR